jgi:hypothetical protein
MSSQTSWGDTPPSISDADGNTSVDENTTSQVEEQEPKQPLLEHMTKKKPLPPGNVKRLLSSTANKPTQPQEVNLNGIIYRQVNMASTIYAISSCHAAGNKSLLVGQGANGGIAGDNVCVISKTGKTVDIQGIDNHRINEIPIVTAGGVINTQKGPVIAIMHQYVYTGKGKSIHSCAQLEAHKQTVHDKSIKVGGKQRIETLDGYVIPLNIRSGLPYVSI